MTHCLETRGKRIIRQSLQSDDQCWTSKPKKGQIEDA